MLIFLRSLGRGTVTLLTNHKLLLMFIFVITAGQEFQLPEWLNITVGLTAMFAVLIWWLNQR